MHYAFGFDLERIGAIALRVSYDRITLATALERTLAAGNLLPAPGSETWAQSATATGGQADPAGGSLAWKFEDTSNTAAQVKDNWPPGAYVSGHALWWSGLIKKDPGASNFMRLGRIIGGSQVDTVSIHLGTGATSGNMAGAVIFDLGSWWFLAAPHPGAVATDLRWRVYPAAGLASAFPSLSNAAMGSCTLYGLRVADATVDPATADPTRPETIDVRLDAGTFVHVTPPSEVDHEVFAAALANAVNATPGVHGTHAVTFDPTSGYELTLDEQFALKFSTVATPAEGTRMREILGLSGDVEADGSFTVASDVRPHYFIVPATQGRTSVSDEYEPDDVVSEDVTDGGETDQISREVDEVWLDWTQTGEDPLDLAGACDPGTPVYERHETAAIPWSYQRAWTHHQRGFDPIIVTEGSEVTAHRLRAEGASFKPERMAADYDMWSIAFRTRLLGRSA